MKDPESTLVQKLAIGGVVIYHILVATLVLSFLVLIVWAMYLLIQVGYNYLSL